MAFSPLDPKRDVPLPSLYPVRALKIYVDRTVQWHRFDQLFVCFGGKNKGAAVTKQRMCHWVIDMALPLGVHTHSSRGMASSQALF